MQFTQRQLSTIEGNKVTSTDNSTVTQQASHEADRLFTELADLVNDQFRPWYCRKFYQLGREQTLKLAAIARADAKTDRRKYFSVLLKRA